MARYSDPSCLGRARESGSSLSIGNVESDIQKRLFLDVYMTFLKLFLFSKGNVFNLIFKRLFLIPFFVCLTNCPVHCKQLTLRLLIWDGYAPAEVQNAFSSIIKSKYDIDLKFEITNASNPDDFFDRLRMDDVDLISPAHNLPKDSRFNLTTNGLTLPIDLDHIPNYEKLIPELYKQPWAMEGDRIYAVPIVHGIYGLAYNLDKVKMPPTSWNIFWKPEYQGLYMVNRDYYELNIYIAALALGNDSKNIFHYDMIKGPALENKIHQLAKNSGFFWQGFDKPENYGHFALATTWRFTFPRENDYFNNWRIAVPREGTPWWIDTLMISHTLKDRPLLRRIAEDWINYLLEPEIQANILANQLGICPVTSEAMDIYTEQILSPADRKKIKVLFKNLIPWRILNIRDRNAFNLLWNEALIERRK